MVQLLLAVIYLAFISLGLPDSLLGAAWPSMYKGFGVPLSWAGVLSMIIALGTVVSSLLSDRLTKKLGAGRVTALSVGMTAAALFGFSASHSFWMLCLWAVPYGLGAGSVDAALNNYVALHYASRHMSWLHCMWGVGASLGPYIMGAALTGGRGWNAGYRTVACIQIGLTAILIASLPLWKKRAGPAKQADAPKEAALPLRQTLRIPGAWEVMASFFCYCALEQTTGLWAASYLTLHVGIPAQSAARFAGLFFLGVTAGRAAGGFLTMALDDTRMVRLGQLVVLAGVGALLIPGAGAAAKCGLVLIGLGCAPVYPCLIHATPARFGAEQSQAIIGVQMASAYVGTCLMPPLFGLLTRYVNIACMPYYLLAILAMMALMNEKTVRKTRKGDN
jgi:fucose permease